MRLNKIGPVLGVKCAKTFEDVAYICSTEGIRFKSTYIHDIECHSFYIKDDSFLYYDKNGHFHVLIDEEDFLFKGYGFFPDSFNGHEILLKYDNFYDRVLDQFVFKVGLFNIRSKVKVKDFSTLDNHGFYIQFKDRYLCTKEGLVLKSVSTVTGQYVWQTDLTELCKYSLPDKEVQGMIRKVFGVLNDKLWIWTDNSQLLVLDIHTGAVLARYRIPDLDPLLFNYGFLFPYFDEKKGVIAFLEHRFYIEFDLNTGTLSLLKNFDTGQPDTDWNFSINTFTDDYVYFTARRGPDRSSPSHLGVFNRQSLEVEWGQDLELWKTDPYCFLNQTPQYAGGKLYALDNKGTLHIFEKE